MKSYLVSTRFGYYFSHSDYQFNIVYFRISLCLILSVLFCTVQCVRCRIFILSHRMAHLYRVQNTIKASVAKIVHFTSARWISACPHFSRCDYFCFVLYCMGSSYFAAAATTAIADCIPSCGINFSRTKEIKMLAALLSKQTKAYQHQHLCLPSFALFL